MNLPLNVVNAGITWLAVCTCPIRNEAKGSPGGSDAVAVGVESAGTEAAEIEVARARSGPAVEIELVITELIADLDRVPALHPGQIIGELPAVDGFKAEADPAGAQRECTGYCP